MFFLRSLHETKRNDSKERKRDRSICSKRGTVVRSAQQSIIFWVSSNVPQFLIFFRGQGTQYLKFSPQKNQKLHNDGTSLCYCTDIVQDCILMSMIWLCLFPQGTGFPCSSSGCPLMGHYADSYSGVTSSSQKFYFNTGDQINSFARKWFLHREHNRAY